MSAGGCVPEFLFLPLKFVVRNLIVLRGEEIVSLRRHIEISRLVCNCGRRELHLNCESGVITRKLKYSPGL